MTRTIVCYMRSILLRGAALIASAILLGACGNTPGQDAQNAAMPPPEVAVVKAKAHSPCP